MHSGFEETSVYAAGHGFDDRLADDGPAIPNLKLPPGDPGDAISTSIYIGRALQVNIIDEQLD